MDTWHNGRWSGARQAFGGQARHGGSDYCAMLGEEHAQVCFLSLGSSTHNSRVKDGQGSRYPFMIFRSAVSP
ncbi:MAG: hypothetical protein ACFNKE_04385 [Neisseria elongata]